MKPLLAALALFIASAAHAGWDGSVGEDPMTDEPFAIATVALSGYSFPQFGFKCWKGGQLQGSVIVGPYDDSANYASEIPIKVRVDKDQPVEWTAYPSKLGDFLAQMMSPDANPDMLDTVKKIREAKQSVAVSVGNSTLQDEREGIEESL
jgi:hypothetical protein